MSERAVPNNVAELIERLAGRESLEFEAKAARDTLPSSVWSTISAFANTAGGWLVLGLVERDDGWIVEGVANPSRMAQQLADQLRNPQKISYPVSGAHDLTIEAIDGHAIVALRVPPAPRQSRPVYIGNNPFDGTYVRGYTGDHHCSRQEVERMMREASDLAADQVILPNRTWDDLDQATFRGYRQRFQTANPDSPHNRLSDDAFLAVMGGFRRDPERQQQGITVAGLLMFGTDLAIRTWRSRHLIDIRVVPGDLVQPLPPDWRDRVVFEGNLLDAFDVAYRRLIADLPVPFAIRDGVRVSDTPQHVAVREALVNLLVHADYRETLPSLLVRFDRGFLFRNPGNSRVRDLDSTTGDRADPRNPELVRMFRLIGLADEAGSGVPRIVQAWHQLGYEPPAFDVGHDRYEFVVTMGYVDLLSPADRDWLNELGLSFGEEEQLALITARHEGTIDNASLRVMTGLHPADATKLLGGLRDRGLLRMIGARRGARYELDPWADAASSHDFDPATDDLEPSTDDLPTATDDFGPSSHDLDPSTDDLSLSTNDLGDRPTDAVPIQSAESDLPHDPIWIDLQRIASPVSSVTYVESMARDEIIVTLCAVRPLSLLQLTWLLGRTKTHLYPVLRGLVRQGRLEYEFPHHPRHQHQRYLSPAPGHSASQRANEETR